MSKFVQEAVAWAYLQIFQIYLCYFCQSKEMVINFSDPSFILAFFTIGILFLSEVTEVSALVHILLDCCFNSFSNYG